MSTLEPYLQLRQPLYSLENIEKIDDYRLAPVQGNNNLDGGQQISFFKPKDGTFVRLADAYLEFVITYNTQSPAETASDGADVTFENDFVSKMFNSVELYIGNVPIEIINPSYIASEMIGLTSYSTDEDRCAGASFGWIPDYGPIASELTPSTVLQSLLWSFPNANVTGTAANPSVLQFTVPNAGGAALANAAAVEAVTNTLTSNMVLAEAGNTNNSGYFRRKIFYNKPQSVLSGGAAGGAPGAAGTQRSVTLSVPLYHFFQTVGTYDKVIHNLQIDIRLNRASATASVVGNTGAAPGIAVGRLCYSQAAAAALAAAGNAAAVQAAGISNVIGINTTNINLILPQYRLTSQGKERYLREATKEQNMICLTRFMVGKQNIPVSLTSFTYDLLARSNVPRYVMIGFKNNTLGGVPIIDTVYYNNSLFTHAYVTNMILYVAGERYPYSYFNCDFSNNKYQVPYMMFRESCKKMGFSPSMDYIDFRDRFPIFCFDLSARLPVLDTYKSSASVQLQITRSPPAAGTFGYVVGDSVDIFGLLLLEKPFKLDFVSGVCNNFQPN